MLHQSHLHTAVKIIEAFKGQEPLSAFLKKFFTADKKYGSRDRKQIAKLCYQYFRLGKSSINLSVEERIIVAAFLCETSPSPFLAFHRPEWNEHTGLSLNEKLKMLNGRIDPGKIFPWKNELTHSIDHETYSLSMLQQPDLFLRIRPGQKEKVTGKLTAAGLSFCFISDNTLSLPNGTAVDRILEPDREAVVQDASSQQVLNFPLSISHYPLRAWDCCAASGGKSILLYDLLQGRVELTVSDIRESILANCRKRFATAGITHYDTLITDLGQTDPVLPAADFPMILCDVPCTGSGTWSRTPEQLGYFEPARIGEFAEKQQRIASSALSRLAPGGLFIYITCSVFTAENEGNVDWIKEKFHLRVLQVEYIKGVDQKADTMFVAVLSK